MIHQVQANPDDVTKLRQIVELQLLVLEAAADVNEVSPEWIAEHLQAAYGDDELETSDNNATKTANWIVKKKKSLLDRLNLFAAHNSVDEKKQFVRQLREDVELLFAPQPGKFQVTFHKLSDDEKWKAAAGDFLEYFYKLWRADTKDPGFPAYLFPHWSGEEKSYSRWDFLDSFQRANPHLTMCVMCDATAFRTQVDSRVFVSIEHFFPKTVYPQLAIHPYNLVPICSYCNSLKRDFDLLEKCCDREGITEILLPYQQYELGLETMAYIKVTERTGSRQANEHPLEIKLKPGRDHTAVDVLIEHFEQAYDVQKRWNNELDQICEQVFRRTQQFLTGDVLMGNDLSDVGFLVKRLQLLMAITSTDNLGQDPHAMTTIWLLKYWIDELEAHGEEALIFCNLHTWADEHKEHWKELREEVDALSRRVPNFDGALQ